MELQIRAETAADRPRIAQLVAAAFEHAEHATHDEAGLVERLRDSAAFIPELSLVAELDGEIIGHALFTRLPIVDGSQAHDELSLAPLAVAPGRQRQGIGGKLIKAGHELARQLGFRAVILVGHPAYYPRFGYRPARGAGILPPQDWPDEVFMVCELLPGSLRGVRGTVHYPPEFRLDEEGAK